MGGKGEGKEGEKWIDVVEEEEGKREDKEGKRERGRIREGEKGEEGGK